jgi:hypothetical protein
MCDYQFYQCISLQTVAMLDIKGNSDGTAIGIKFRVSYLPRTQASICKKTVMRI